MTSKQCKQQSGSSPDCLSKVCVAVRRIRYVGGLKKFLHVGVLVQRKLHLGSRSKGDDANLTDRRINVVCPNAQILDDLGHER